MEFVVISGKFNVVGISGVVLAVLTIFGEVPRRKSVPERPSCIGKRVSRKLKQTGNNTDSTCGLEQTAECIFLYFADRASQYIYHNINQLDVLNFIMSLFSASTCFEHKCSSSGGQNCTIQSLVSSHL